MKKIILLLSFMPIALFAQNSSAPVSNGVSVKYPVKFHSPREGYTSPVRINSQQQTSAPVATHKNRYSRPQGSAYVPAVIKPIGTTVYDLQTNGALAKRLQVYSNEKESYVWIKSDDDKDPNFTTRYSGYNSFDGSNWLTQYGNSSSIEFDRSGWPNINQVTTEGQTYEMLISHYAQAGNTVYAGGIYWYKNSGIGNTDFTKTVDQSTNRSLTAGLLWPRIATSNNLIYMIGTYEDDRRISGVYNPIVYFCYNTSTGKFESQNITLPGYDATRYGTGSADEYSIDARGSSVAIVTGGFESDLALWKSTDSGKTFTKTIINNYAQAPFNPKAPPTFTDTTIADDGTACVALDNNGVAHVTYTPVKTLDPGADSGVTYINDPTDSIVYWNDRDKQKINVGGCVDYDKLGSIQFSPSQTDPNFAGYGHNLATFSNIAIDPSGDIFVVFSAPDEDDIDDNGNSFRHVYCSVFNAAQDVWLPQQDIVQTDLNGKPMWYGENVYATVARDADSKLRFVYMQDPNAGIYNPGNAAANNSSSPEAMDTMIYQEIATTDLLTSKLGLVDLGVNERIANNLFSTGSIYPNPANDNLNLSLNLTHSANVIVKMYNMLGSEMEAQNYELPLGANNIQLSLSNLPAGVYLCNISAGGYTTTDRVVIER